jgi:hypothetical protein
LDQLAQASGIHTLAIAHLHALRQPENLSGALVLGSLRTALLSAVLQVAFAFFQKGASAMAFLGKWRGIDGFEHDRSPEVMDRSAQSRNYVVSISIGTRPCRAFPGRTQHNFSRNVIRVMFLAT